MFYRCIQYAQVAVADKTDTVDKKNILLKKKNLIQGHPGGLGVKASDMDRKVSSSWPAGDLVGCCSPSLSPNH